MKSSGLNGIFITCMLLLFTSSISSCSSGGSSTDENYTNAKPFPQHVEYAGTVIKPDNVDQSSMDETVTNFYAVWKNEYVKTVSGSSPAQEFVQYEPDPVSTVSEAHGYGMVISAYMGDKHTFDAMYHYYKAHPSTIGKNLMSWKQTLKNGNMVEDIDDSDSATDGDMDIAYGLLLADAQWGSNGSIDYKNTAIDILHDILSYDVNQDNWTLLVGDWAKDSDEIHTRPSDFMIEHLLAFADADTENSGKWKNVYNKINSIVNYQFTTGGSGNTGLMPDFMVESGANYIPVTGEYLESTHDGDFGYNACRTPWRLAMAYITRGETALLAQQQKQAQWLADLYSAGPANFIRAGYYVKNGTNGSAYGDYDDLCFTAPFAVNAMIGNNQEWINKLWASITEGGEDGYEQIVDYYGDTIRMQVLIVVSGNWWLP